MNTARYGLILIFLVLHSACTMPASKWYLLLQHSAQGQVVQGSIQGLVSAVRRGCQIRVGWGARRLSDPTRTIEHSAEPVWISVRDGNQVEVQLDSFLINLAVLGEPATDHPRRQTYGGTDRAVSWRANLKTDGQFDAVWFDEATGKLIHRVPQRHPMSWFADCPEGPASALFPKSD